MPQGGLMGFCVVEEWHYIAKRKGMWLDNLFIFYLLRNRNNNMK